MKLGALGDDFQFDIGSGSFDDSGVQYTDPGTGSDIWQTVNESAPPGSTLQPVYQPPVIGIPQVTLSTTQSGQNPTGSSWLDSINKLSNIGMDIYAGVSKVNIAKQQASNPFYHSLALRRPNTVVLPSPGTTLSTTLSKNMMPLGLAALALFLLTR